AEQAVPDLRRKLKDPEISVRRSAATALGRMGDAARPATPALLAAQQDAVGEVAQAARAALVRLGVTVVPELLDGLKKDDPIKGCAAATIIQIGEATVPALVKALRAEEAPLRAGAIETLRQIKPVKRDELVPDIVDLFKDSSPVVRLQAAR